MMIRKILLILLTILCPLLTLSAQETITLSGFWDYSLGDSLHYDDQVILPGSLLTNGKGNPVSVKTPWTGSLYDSSYYYNPYMAPYRVEGNMKFPFFLTPERHYVGDVWYRRRVYVPASWSKKRITLYLERPHIETTVIINGQKILHQNSLSTPHVCDVTRFLRPGERNTIAICVYNGIDRVGVGQDSHSVTDQTQGNWNGIVGRMELQAQPSRIYIKKVKLTPKPFEGKVLADVEFGGSLTNIYFNTLEVIAQRENVDSANIYTTFFDVTKNPMHIEMSVGNEVALWDEFFPNLYRIGCSI